MGGAKHMLTVSASCVANAMANVGRFCLTAAAEVAERFKLKDIAAAIGKPPSTLAHELNPHYPSAKLGLQDAVRMSVASGDFAILHAFATECRHVAIPLPDVTLSGECALTAGAAYMKESADVVRVVTTALASGQSVTTTMLGEFERETLEAIDALQNLLAILSARHAVAQIAASSPR